MARLFYLHWNKDEAAAHVKVLQAAGHAVRCHAETGKAAQIEPLPEALVVSLERLPSHGRAVAGWFWEAKKRRSIPLIFVGGEVSKTAIARRQFPGAHFCERRELPARIDMALSMAAEARETPSDTTRKRQRRA